MTEDVGSYFEGEKPFEFFSTGSTLLDKALGGGWATERCLNITGDSSSGKSLLAFECATNFLNKFEYSRVVYIDTEAAFNPEFQRSLGIPVDRIELRDDVETVEELFDCVDRVIENNKNHSSRVLVIIDSLDALSSAAELKRDIYDGTFAAEKPKKLSEIFRRLNSTMHKSKVTFMTISQVRDNLAFGPSTKTRSGGKAIRFYSSQEVWLKNVGREQRTVKGIKKVIGQKVQASVEKSRMGPGYGKSDFTILFNFGVDDLDSCIEYLKSVKRLDDVGLNDKEAKDVVSNFRRNKMSVQEYQEILDKARNAVNNVYDELEEEVKIDIRKY